MPPGGLFMSSGRGVVPLESMVRAMGGKVARGPVLFDLRRDADYAASATCGGNPVWVIVYAFSGDVYDGKFIACFDGVCNLMQKL